jgi:hypothetical protein
MKHLLIMSMTLAWLCITVFLLPSPASADVVILKNGQVYENVTIIEEKDTLHFEDSRRSYFINRDAVEAVIRTGNKKSEKIAIPDWAEKHLSPLPAKIRSLARDHFIPIMLAVSGILVFFCLVLLKFLWANIRPLHDARREKRRIIAGVRNLDSQEKAVLREFAIFDQNTLELPVEDPTVSGLIRKDILQPTREKGEYSVSGLVLPVTINPLARRRITPRAVDLPPDWKNDDAQKQAIIRARPQFIHDKEQFISKVETKRPGE